MRRLDELYVRKDDRQDIQNYENHSGVDGDLASNKPAAICWRYQKAKGITKIGQHRFGVALFLYLLENHYVFSCCSFVRICAEPVSF